MPRVDGNVRSLAQSLVQDGKLTRADADKLVDAALQDKVLSPVERAELKQTLTAFADRFDPDAKAKLNTFLSVSNAALRNLAHELEKDGVVDLADAGKLAALVDKDGRVTSGEKVSLRALMVSSKMSPEARSVLSAKVGQTEAGPGTGAPTIDVKLPDIDGSRYTLSTEGHFQVGGTGTPARFDAGGALAAYRAAAALAKSPPDVLKDVPLPVKTRMLAHLEKAFAAGAEDSALPRVARQRMRSAAATTLLTLITSSTRPEEKGLRDQAVASYLAHANAEPMHDLRASMYLNAVSQRSTLSPPQAGALDALGALVVPNRPPYEKWFEANGSRTINTVHYAHDDCWVHGGDPIAKYQADGWKLVSSDTNATPPSWVLEKANPNAPGGEVKMRMEVKRTHDGLFEKMDDPKTNIVLYTGHSNLGGNVSEELRLGNDEKGQKLVLMAMCRGKQNIPEFANKYPNAHFLTTDDPSYFSSVGVIAKGITDGALRLSDYSAMQRETGRIYDNFGNANYFYPNEERRYAHYDLDKDGVTDAQGSLRDRLFDVGLTFPAGSKVDLKARPTDVNPLDLDGSPVLHAVQFLNTLTTYHVDHHNNSSRFTPADNDAFLGGGWFKGGTEDVVRITPETVNGKTMYRIAVNTAYADQTPFALGTLVQYEVCKQMLKDRNGGVLTQDDNVRATLFAGEYLSYMYCSYDEAEGSLRAIAARSGLGNFGYEKVREALDSDGHGYVTDAQMNAFKKLLAPTPIV